MSLRHSSVATYICPVVASSELGGGDSSTGAGCVSDRTLLTKGEKRRLIKKGEEGDNNEEGERTHVKNEFSES